MSWWDLLVMVECAPRESAVSRASNPDWWVTPEVRMLAAVEKAANLSWWIHTTDAVAKPPKNEPAIRPLTTDELEAATEARSEFDLIDLAEASERLGLPLPRG